MDGYVRRELYPVEDDEEEDDEELPPRVKYSVILQEEYDFMDEEED